MIHFAESRLEVAAFQVGGDSGEGTSGRWRQVVGGVRQQNDRLNSGSSQVTAFRIWRWTQNTAIINDMLFSVCGRGDRQNTREIIIHHLCYIANDAVMFSCRQSRYQ